MRQGHLADLEHVVVLLLLEHLIAKLQCLEMIGVVVEVYSSRALLQEIRAFHFDLSIIHALFELIMSGSSSFEPVDAVALVRLIDLRQDNLLKTHWLGLGLAEQRLEVVSDGGL